MLNMSLQIYLFTMIIWRIQIITRQMENAGFILCRSGLKLMNSSCCWLNSKRKPVSHLYLFPGSTRRRLAGTIFITNGSSCSSSGGGSGGRGGGRGLQHVWLLAFSVQDCVMCDQSLRGSRTLYLMMETS